MGCRNGYQETYKAAFEMLIKHLRQVSFDPVE
jgi:hypothetical protein